MFKRSIDIGRFLSPFLILGLILPSPALALRQQQSPKVRSGLEESLNPEARNIQEEQDLWRTHSPSVGEYIRQRSLAGRQRFKIACLGSGDREPFTFAAYLLWAKENREHPVLDEEAQGLGRMMAHPSQPLEIEIDAVESNPSQFEKLTRILAAGEFGPRLGSWSHSPAIYNEKPEALRLVNRYLPEIRELKWIQPRNQDLLEYLDSPEAKNIEALVFNQVLYQLTPEQRKLFWDRIKALPQRLHIVTTKKDLSYLGESDPGLAAGLLLMRPAQGWTSGVLPNHDAVWVEKPPVLPGPLGEPLSYDTGRFLVQRFLDEDRGLTKLRFSFGLSPGLSETEEYDLPLAEDVQVWNGLFAQMVRVARIGKGSLVVRRESEMGGEILIVEPARSGLEEVELLGDLPETMRGYYDHFLALPMGNSVRAFSPVHPSTLLFLGAMERLKPVFSGAQVLDTGTGGGILGLAAVAAPGLNAARVTATDLDERAVPVVQRNALDLGVSDRVETRVGDLLQPVKGRTFNAAIHSADSFWNAQQYLGEVGTVLPEDGIALLLWSVVDEEELRRTAEEASMAFAPLFRGMGSGSYWQVYAASKSPSRLSGIRALIKQEEIRVAQQRVAEAMERLTGGREDLRRQIISPSVAGRYPALSVLDSDRFPFIRIDPGGVGTEVLADHLESKRVTAATYYGSPEEFARFDGLAVGKGVTSTPAAPGSDLFEEFLQQVLQNLLALNAEGMEAWARERGVDLQRLAEDLELLEKA